MGFSEWGFVVKSDEDISQVLHLIQQHNLLVDNDALQAETLIVYALLRRIAPNSTSTSYYLCAGNSGGRQATDEYLTEHCGTIKIYHPFMKPSWWQSCQDIVWSRHTSSDSKPSISRLVAEQLKSSESVSPHSRIPSSSITVVPQSSPKKGSGIGPLIKK